MTSSKPSDHPPSSPPPQSYYHPLPPEPYPRPQQPQYVIVLPRYYNRPPAFRCRTCRRYLICFAALLLLGLAIFLLWPSDPEVSIVRLRLDRFHVRTFPKISLDIALDVTVKIRNRDFFSIDYKSLVVAIGYRGNQLGYALSDHGHIRARRSSYVNATLELDAVEVIFDAIPLIWDLAKGEITFDTDTKISGQLGLLLFEIPLEAEVSCEINVDIRNETIERQNCYPE